jgi:hypothetical protein
VVIIKGAVRLSGRKYHVAVDVRTMDETLLFRTHSFEHSEGFAQTSEQGAFTLRCVVPAHLLPAGTYRVGIIAAESGRTELLHEDHAVEFTVLPRELVGGVFVGTRGLLTPKCDWESSSHAH